MTEFHGARFTAMLTADPHFQLRADAPTGRYGNSNQFAYSVPIEHLERIVRKYTTFDIVRKESARVVATEPERGLGQIIGPE